MAIASDQNGSNSGTERPQFALSFATVKLGGGPTKEEAIELNLGIDDELLKKIASA